MHWLLEHFQHMKQALEAFKFSNISVDEYGSTESADKKNWFFFIPY